VSLRPARRAKRGKETPTLNVEGGTRLLPSRTRVPGPQRLHDTQDSQSSTAATGAATPLPVTLVADAGTRRMADSSGTGVSQAQRDALFKNEETPTLDEGRETRSLRDTVHIAMTPHREAHMTHTPTGPRRVRAHEVKYGAANLLGLFWFGGVGEKHPYCLSLRATTRRDRQRKNTPI
jgi:hypothetical protein